VVVGFLAVAALLVACGANDSPAASPATTAAATSATAPPTSGASETSVPADSSFPAGTEHLHFEFGPVDVQPGQNSIEYSKGKIPKPDVDGWILQMSANLKRADGTVPPVDVIHLHHGVWLNASRPDTTVPTFPERFFAAGEEKTTTEFPPGYGYQYRATDRWVLNYMLHNLTSQGEKIWVTYDLDFLPASAPAAAHIVGAHPVWLDVQNGSGYPVFDVIKGTGTNGTFTYPDQATDPYHGGPPKNIWSVDTDGVLIGTGGHLHPGGLHDDLYLDRNGQSAHLFESEAKYFEPAGAVSWDVAMTVTNPSWAVAVHPGDTLRISTTYDSARASWYESMGIMVVWMADGASGGADPFTTKVDEPGHLTHGHLPENDHHGGKDATLPDVTALPTAPVTDPIHIASFFYGQGDMRTGGTLPSVKQGQPLTFINDDSPVGPGIWHSITACKAPCNLETGIAYPIADADVPFDSGQLGTQGAPTTGHIDWSTPTSLPPGTYTYFCRIHPFMRGAFVVVKV
jgi:plastocyanin